MKSLVVMSNEALYFWLLGASIMLVAVFAGLDNPEAASHLAGLGSLIMIAALAAPPIHGALRNLNALWRHFHTDSSGGDQA